MKKTGGVSRAALSIFLLIALSLLGRSSQEGNPIAAQAEGKILHTPLLKFSQGLELEVRVDVTESVDEVVFCYRIEEFLNFQKRRMTQTAEGQFLYSFDTSLLTTQKFDYYIMAKGKDDVLYLPVRAPEQVFTSLGEKEESGKEISSPESEVEEGPFHFPVSVRINGSIQAPAHQSVATESEAVLSDGNIMLSKFIQTGNFQVNFALNTALTNHPLEGDQNFQLSHFDLSVASRSHKLTLGDISMSGSNLALLAIGRRGAEYRFDNRKLFFQLFNIHSQQPRGWGDLLPTSDSTLYGGTLGFSLWNQQISTRAVYVSGDDDPSQGRNVSGSFLPRRKGNVWALVQEMNFFAHRLNLRGEYARSDTDIDLDDEAGKVRDEAWNIEGDLSFGGVRFQGRYKNIGTDFNPIGHQFFTNDRKGYDLTMGWAYKKIRIDFFYSDEKDNTKNDTTRFTSFNKNTTASFSWNVFPWLHVSLGYQKADQETYTSPDKEVLQLDMMSQNISFGLNFLLSSLINLQVSGMHTKVNSKAEPLLDNTNSTLNVGGNFRFSDRFFLFPTFSYSVNTNDATAAQTKMFNSLITAEYHILPQAISLSAFLSSSTTHAGAENITNQSASLNVNFYLSKICSKLQNSILTLRGELREMKAVNYSQKYESIFVMLHFSF
ncbi:MAG: porin [Candidatus Aminicenantes bacterium]|nr:porin [Candidatus Aminicenantes bacterium]